ncbi:1-phosphofructokinase [Pullulanibacillus camelliae]|uniref:Tagatose-6-phosphate kinase n=1 Tax=Pullulanibacillus camelliae TaxID=1707096 RepID=A0A8J2YLD3_9BACL|nr:1-phosphofructokinase [Pullulanibacillus camelliae]GGE50765.1 1-phosphofructokinase [Pullulanibacillus camelliae]
MIYTCTFNPSIDFFVKVEEFKWGELNRIKTEMKVPGGKGINVSRVLQRLGVENKALGFIGGFTGQFITDALHTEGIETDFISVEGDSRINIKLQVEGETELNGAGPAISSKQLQAFLDQLRRLQPGDLLVLAGSIPQALPDTLYRDIVKDYVNRDVKVIVDATKQLLKDVLPYRPFLIKPNHIELGELFGVTIQTPQEAIPYGKRLIERGAKHVIVSMGDKGNLLFKGDHVYYTNIPKGELRNSVGAGDSVVAGFIASYVKLGDSVEAFRYGAAAGSASAYSEGFCTKPFIEQLITQINVQQV